MMHISECGDIVQIGVSDRFGLYTPDFPNFYEPGRCAWVIKVSVIKHIYRRGIQPVNKYISVEK